MKGATKNGNGEEQQAAFAKNNIAEGTCGTCKWTIDTTGTLTISTGSLSNWENTGTPPWYANRNDIKSVKTDGAVVLATGQNMFSDCAFLADADLSGLETSGVKNLNGMFSACSSLKELDLGNIDLSGVSRSGDVQNMFRNCGSMEKLKSGAWSSALFRPTFPVDMYDTSTNEFYTAGTMIPAVDDRTFSTTMSDMTKPTGSIESTNNVAGGRCHASLLFLQKSR